MKRHHEVAGSFYPADKKELQTEIDNYLGKVKLPKINGDIKALISPHASYKYSGSVAAFGYKAIENKKYKNIFIFGPAHRCEFEGLALSECTNWDTPLGEIKISDIRDDLKEENEFSLLEDAHEIEHSIEVQLPFLQTVLQDKYEIIPISIGKVFNHFEIAKALDKYIEDDDLIIVSSDLSHYQYFEDAEEEDRHTIEEICRLENDISHEEACGADGIKILIELARQRQWKPQMLDYKHSGDTTEERDEVVGYGSIIFTK